jgi:hypothetical protein
VVTSARAGSTISNELLPLLVASLPSSRDVAEVVQAALDRAIMYVAVDEPTQPGVQYALDLSSPGQKKSVAVLAVAAGAPAGGKELLGLRPLGSQGEAALQAFLSALPTQAAQAQAVDPFIGRLLGGGRYEIVSAINEGSAGRVYRGRHLLLDRPIAIKVLHDQYAKDPIFTAHFHGEARAAGRLDHLNICRVFDFGQDDDGLLYIVMELLSGTDLCTMIESKGPVPAAKIAELMTQVCAALSVAHERGIVHRDIKAENIVVMPTVDDDGQPADLVKVCDFGLAMSVDLSSSEQGAAFQGTCGTPAYMPPEQVRGEQLDARADVYACGVLMYVLATGRLPFDHDDPRRVLRMHLQTEPVRPSVYRPNIDPHLEACILKAMSKDRSARFANARELRAVLRMLRSTETRPVAVPAAVDVTPAPISAPPVDSVRFNVAATRAAPALGDREAGLADAVFELGRAVVWAPSEAESFPAIEALLEGRGGVTFFRAEPSSPSLRVYDRATAPADLASLAGASAVSGLADVLARRGVLSITLLEGVDVQQIIARLRDEPATSTALPRGSVVTEDARLGRHRALPWSVDLAATQVAFAMAAPGADAATRVSAARHALRAVATPEEARMVLESSDLVAAVAGVSAWDVACAIGAGIAQPVCVRLLASLAQELLNNSTAVPLDLVRMLARRLSTDRSPDADELLRGLRDRAMIAPEDLCDDLRSERLADLTAERLIQTPLQAIAPLEAAKDIETYATELGVLEQAMQLLFKQGRLIPFAHAFRTIAAHAADKSHPFRSATALRALSSLQESAVLDRIALVLLKGAPASHEAAQSILLTAGAAGARALCNARTRAGNELDLGARKRFAAALRLIGPSAAPAIGQALRQAGPDSLEVFVLEDLLRAIPEGTTGDIGVNLHRLTRHFAPPVRRATLGALVGISGPHVRPTLVDALTDQDEGVRLSALIGLQRVGGLEPSQVPAVEAHLLTGSDEIRAGAAATLRCSNPAAAPAAAAALTRALQRQKVSRVFRLGVDDADSPMVVEATARALVAVGGAEGRKAVKERASRAQGDLAKKLTDLLRST